MKKSPLSILLTLFIMMLPCICFSQGPLKVGALIPYTGRWGDSGRECAKGMLDAAKWLNQHDGIYGIKLEIIVIDDTSQSAETMAAYRKLNEADRILLLYIYDTETALALIPHFHFDQIPTFVSTLPSQFTDASKYQYVFSITPTPLDLAKIAMHFISDKSEVKGRKPRVVFVGSADYFGQHFLEEAKAYAKKIGIDVGPDFWIPDMSLSTERAGKNSLLLSAINSHKPDFTYLSLTAKEASSLLEEAKKMDLKTKWICNMRAFDENLIPFEGVLGVQPISPFGENVPWIAEIKEAHQRWHPNDSHTVSYVEGWATVQVISEALGKSLSQQSTSRLRIKLVLEGFKNRVTGGLTPPLTITSKDHRPSVECRVFIVKNGKLLRNTSFISIGR